MSGLSTFLRNTRENLKRNHRGYSLRAVAKRIGLHHSYLGKLEKGEKASIADNRLMALARDYGVDEDYLLALAGKLSPDICEAVYRNPGAFSDFIHSVYNSPGEQGPQGSPYSKRLEHRVGELKTLNRMLQDEIRTRQYLEANLKRAQSETLTILSNLQDIVIVSLDTKMHIKWASPNATEVFRTSGSDIVGQECHMALKAGGCPCDKCPAPHTLKDGKIYESSFTMKNGTSWLARSIPITSDSGETESILICAYNVTQLVNTREKLSTNKRRLQTILKDIPALICRFSPNGEIVYVNEGCCEYYGMTERELVGSSFLDLFPEEGREDIWSNYMNLSKESPSKTYELECVGRGEEVRCQRWTGRAIFDQQGEVESYQAIAQDMTKEWKTLRQNNLLATIIENTPSICVIKDLNLRVIAANMAFAKVAGHDSVESLIGKTDAEIFDVPSETQPVKGYMDDEKLVQTFAKGQVLDRHEIVVLPDGTKKMYHTIKFPIFDENGTLIATANISTGME